jgi:hypothetical protein
LGVLFWVVGATEPYWRSGPVLAIFASSLLGGAAAAYALFRREWHAAERKYARG